MKKRKMILAYHSVGAHPIKEIGAKLYAVPLYRFREQMEYAANKETGPLPSTSLGAGGDSPIITFDDGDITNYLNAYPILKELDLKAYFFIIGTWVGTPGYMSWKEIEELKNNSMTIGSHGMTHRILTELSDEELNYELRESKKVLESHLKTQVDYFSIPRGLCNEKIIDKARDVGYKTILTSDNRIVVRSGWDLNHFIKVLENGYSLSDMVENMIKNSLRGILGIKNYDRLRSALLSKS